MLFYELGSVVLQDDFFAPRQQICNDITIPDCLEHCRETGRISAFELKWQEGDENCPNIFWDSDVAKVIEGACLMQVIRPDSARMAEINRIVELIISTQQPDGYLNTHYSVTEREKRWKYLAGTHELYCAGHLIEAAVAHYYATGRRNFLDCMCRYADYIGKVFGRCEGKMRGYPGHEEVELALVKLYRVTGEKRYLELASYFVDERGTEPNYYVTVEKIAEKALKGLQADKPVRAQRTAEGHAVRAVYFYCAVADTAYENGDVQLMDTAKRLFDNIVSKRMYITGGIGSTVQGEAFSFDYALPPDTAYAESCAAVGLALFAKRLLEYTGESVYADIAEKILYNNGLSGISLKGSEFFYANPLEVNSTTLELMHPGRVRQKWFECSCCPTTYCRFLPQLGTFCYSVKPDCLQIDIPAAAKVISENYQVNVSGNYPYSGDIVINVVKGGRFTLKLRVPSWSSEFRFLLGGKEFIPEMHKGYLVIERDWKNGDKIEFLLTMSVKLYFADPRVPAVFGKAAICRGPLVYCVEATDNPGILLHSALLPEKPEFTLVPAADLPEGTLAVKCGVMAVKEPQNDGSAGLYSENVPEYVKTEITAIPYALWQNRGKTDMQVYMLFRH